MNEHEFDAISRLDAWIRDYGHTKSGEFIGDLRLVLAIAKRESSKPDVIETLLSDAFHEKFVAAFAKTPMPCTISAIEPAILRR